MKLRSIGSIGFTQREVDVIACIVNLRSTKKISIFLSISPKTVENYIRNIMLKINCNSREQIIDFVEKSNESLKLKKHYYSLVVEKNFLADLRNLFSYKNKDINCLIVYEREDKLKKLLAYNFQRYLNSIGVNVTLTYWYNNKDFFLKEGAVNEINYIIVIVSKNCEERIRMTKVQVEHVLSMQNNSIDSLGSLIFVLDEKEIEINKFINNSKHNVLCEILNYVDNKYILFLDVLKKILCNKNHNPKIEELLQQYKKEGPLFSTKEDLRKKGGGQDNYKLFHRTFALNKKIIFALLSVLFVVIILKQALLFIPREKPKNKQIINNNLEVTTPSDNYFKSASFDKWNLPYQIDNFVKRTDIINQIWDEFSLKDENKLSIVSLYGLSGAGKTTIAANVIHNPKYDYDFVGWFSVETIEMLKTSYLELGERKHLFHKELSDKGKISIVKEWLRHNKRILLVFDNVFDFETIRDYIPSKGNIIITSKNYNLPGKLEVGVMKKDEALELFNRLTQNKFSTYPKNELLTKNLLQKLGYLPIAIAQAGCYINENMLDISEYLDMYDKEQEELLANQKLPPGEGHLPVYTTWDLSFNAITKHPLGADAVKLLNFLVYCYPEKIPKQLIMQYLYKNTNKKTKIHLNNLINMLRQYSLITVTSKNISVHRLVHDWLKNKHNIKNKYILQNIVESINKAYPAIDKSLKVNEIKALLPHMELILCHAKQVISNKKLTGLMYMLGDGYAYLGNYKKSQGFLDEALVIEKDKHIGSRVNIIKILYALGRTNIKLGNYDDGKKFLEKALDLAQRQYKNTHMQNIKIKRDLGWVNIFLGNYEEAKNMSEKSLLFLEKNYGLNSIKLVETLRTLAQSELYLGNYQTAVQFSGRAIAIVEKIYGPYHLETCPHLEILGYAKIRAGDYRKGNEIFNKILSILELNLGSKNVEAIWTFHEIGWTYFLMGDYQKSAEPLNNALLGMEKYYGINHMETAWVLHSNAWRQLYFGDRNKAKLMFDNVYKIIEEYYGLEHIESMWILQSLSWAYFNLGYNELGLKSVKQSLNILNAKKNQVHPLIEAISLSNLGNLHRISGNITTSKEFLTRSLDYLQKYYGPHNINVAIVMGNLGLTYEKLGDHEKKIKYLNRALKIFKAQLNPKHLYISKTLKSLANNKKNKSLGYHIFLEY